MSADFRPFSHLRVYSIRALTVRGARRGALLGSATLVVLTAAPPFAHSLGLSEASESDPTATWSDRASLISQSSGGDGADGHESDFGALSSDAVAASLAPPPISDFIFQPECEASFCGQQSLGVVGHPAEQDWVVRSLSLSLI